MYKILLAVALLFVCSQAEAARWVRVRYQPIRVTQLTYQPTCSQTTYQSTQLIPPTQIIYHQPVQSPEPILNRIRSRVCGPNGCN